MQLQISYSRMSAAAFAILLALGVQPASGAIRFTITDGNPADTQVFTSVSNNVGGFTMSSVVILTGASVGTSLSIGGTSAVIGGPENLPLPGLPEPTSLVVVGLGGGALAVLAAGRRRAKKSR